MNNAINRKVPIIIATINSKNPSVNKVSVLGSKVFARFLLVIFKFRLLFFLPRKIIVCIVYL